MKRVLFVAPCHSLFDERVLRTIRAAESCGCESLLAVDADVYSRWKAQPVRAGGDALISSLGQVLFLSLPRVSPRKSLARLQRFLKAADFVHSASILRPDIVHVHESGSLGLVLSFLFKAIMPEVKVVFDYHDWIPYELSLLVRHCAPAYALLLPLLVLVCRYFASRLDVVVAVSEGQARWVEGNLRVSNIVVIPNVRPYLGVISSGGDARPNYFVPSYLFVGNVMRSRRLELVALLMCDHRLRQFAPRFDVVGDVVDASYEKELLGISASRGIEGSIFFHGPYSHDRQIECLVVPGMVACLFPLTQSENPSKIESISSSNKFYTYANLGVPMILHSSYVEMVGIMEAHGAGFSFSCHEEMVEACMRLWSDRALWKEKSIGARSIASVHSNEVYEHRLSGLYV